MEKQSWRIEEDGKWTYYRDGNKVKGLQKIGDRIFFFNMKGYLIKDTWLNIDGNMFYVLSNGECARGWKWINGYNYYFHEKAKKDIPECSMARNTVIAGVYLGDDGKAEPKK